MPCPAERREGRVKQADKGRRPYATVRAWPWKSPGAPDVPGIGIFHGRKLQAHLTPTEARTMADLLHDLADRLDRTETGRL